MLGEFQDRKSENKHHPLKSHDSLSYNKKFNHCEFCVMFKVIGYIICTIIL